MVDGRSADGAGGGSSGRGLQTLQTLMQYDGGATEVVAGETPCVQGFMILRAVGDVDGLVGEGGEGVVDVVVKGRVVREGEAQEVGGLVGGNHGGDEGCDGGVLEGGVGVAGEGGVCFVVAGGLDGGVEEAG